MNKIIRNDENKTLEGDGDFRRGAWCLTPVAERECFEREEQQRIKKDAKCKKCGAEKILLRIRGMPNQGAILAFEEIFYDVELMGCVIDVSEEFFSISLFVFLIPFVILIGFEYIIWITWILPYIIKWCQSM